MDVKKVIMATPSPQPVKIELELEVNGFHRQLTVAPAARLVDLLREDLELTGTKFSCEVGRCGTCAVHMDNKLVNSCLVMAYQANGTSICTIEGLAERSLDPIQSAFLEEGGFQCGYCTPGMIMAVKALLNYHANPTEEQIKEGLSGNLCRCTGYGGIIRAVQRAIKNLNENEIEGAVGWKK
ncbi:(2Fe-2S)-binding protein [Mesobacillus harenae]|uniref:(2Fe-2S)-binding protein n=1 Tax=Mesobacillus harenae TaxID=2213203 RepID=UPI001580F6FE|nr:(2Fe-2S)-binding protein [Mesobacillus harenae]